MGSVLLQAIGTLPLLQISLPLPLTASLSLIKRSTLTPFHCLALHHRISRIGQHPTLKALHRSFSSSSSAGTSPAASSSSSSPTPEPARLPGPVPQILLDQELLLQKFVASMPPSASTLKGPGGIPPYNASRTLSTDQGSLDSAGTATSYGVHPIVFSLNTVLYTAFMVLYEEMAFFEEGGKEYEVKASQAAVAAVSMVATIVEIDCESLLSFCLSCSALVAIASGFFG